MQDLINQVADDLLKSNYVLALTGAGISVESGIPPFRGKGGVWEKVDPMEYAHIDAFMQNPVKVWNVLLKDMKELLDSAEPGDGHKGLAKLEELKILKTVITQNVDGLHQLAGNSDVIEFHGTFAWHRCLDCHTRRETRRIDLAQIPPRCECGGIYRPECIFFGEIIPPQHLARSQQISAECDIMLVVGTSAIVQPAALMPVIAKRSGAKIIQINPEPTPLTNSTSDCHLMGKAGEILNQILAEIERRRNH